jgi:hypothetical protein
MAAGQCRAAYPVATGIPMPDGMHEPAAHLGPRSRRTKENCRYIEGASQFFLNTSSTIRRIGFSPSPLYRQESCSDINILRRIARRRS